MGRFGRLIPALLLCTWLAAPPALAGGGDANLWIGQRQLSEDRLDSAGVDQPPGLGASVSLDFDWPVALAIDLFSTSDDSTETVPSDEPISLQTEIDTLELHAGVRKLWGERLQPYVGGGLVWLRLSAKQVERLELPGGPPLQTTIVDDDGSGLGFWLDAGLLYRIGGHINVGLDLRWSDAEADVQPVGAGSLTLDSGGTYAGLLVGYHW